MRIPVHPVRAIRAVGPVIALGVSLAMGPASLAPLPSLPSLPRPLSGHVVGVSEGTLIVAGGTDFPVPLFAGGTKAWYDGVYALPAGAHAWTRQPALPHPLAYAAVASIDDGVVVAGGSDGKRHVADAFLLRWVNGGVTREPLPPLPSPVAMAGAGALGRTVFVVGGQASPEATEAQRTLWALDLSASPRRWQALDPVPGAGRILPVVTGQDGRLVVVSGAELLARQDGSAGRRYLTDAHAFVPSRGWQPIASPPRPVVAAPSSAWGESRVLVFGGDDGQHAERIAELKDAHPGFSRDLLSYDLVTDTWTSFGRLPAGVVTTTAVRHGASVVIAGGEDRPGHRVADVRAFDVRAGLATVDEPVQTDVYVAGREGYHTFRIPSLIMTNAGTLLAFAEGRREGRGDAGDIDLVLKRSRDGGASWSPAQVIGDNGAGTFGNPCPVVDRKTGTIWLMTTQNLGEDKESAIIDGTSTGGRTVWVMKSTDDGASWSTPREISARVKKKDWTWYATGPGVGIQTRGGRLVIPANHAAAGSKVHQSHLFYSDDRGKSWKLGGVAADGTNESQVVELADGRLMLNMRNHPPKPENVRAVAISKDGGRTLGETTYDRTLVEPPAQASLLRLSLASRGRGRNRLLFANPAAPRRERMTVRLSYDEGTTWPVSRVLHEGPAAYSSLVALRDGTIGLLYERGEQSPYERVTYARVSLGWLTNGEDTGDVPEPTRQKN